MANPKPTREHQRFYRAFLRKDRRLEGRVFIAVRTTGIYCLLTCRARTPKPENVTFYTSRDAAERAGFRPCRKCRPEVLGGKAALEKLTMRNWLARIAEEDAGIGELARQAGANPSRVYRLFRRSTGRGPLRARAEARLARACEMLSNRRATITEVAYAAGFSSLATFYRWFRRGTGKTPTQFRAARAATARRATESDGGESHEEKKRSSKRCRAIAGYAHRRAAHCGHAARREAD